MVDSQPEKETVEETAENEVQEIQQEDFVEQPQEETSSSREIPRQVFRTSRADAPRG
tara:strand:+ start:1094 stop:1264 length:171 start_codon:yes stop_codon:yes gene_type:complete